MKQEKWIEQLHDKLAEHETPAPADLWADIEAALPDSGQLSSAAGPVQERFQALQPRKARIVTLRRWAAAASVAILLGGGALVWWGQDSQQTEQLTSMAEDTQAEQLTSMAEDTTINNSEEDNSEDPILSTDGNNGAAAPLPSRGGIGGGVSNSTSTENTLASNSDESTLILDKKIQTPPPTPPLEGRGETADDTHVSPSQSDDTHVKQLLPDTPTPTPRPHRLRRQPSLGLYAMNCLGSQDNSNAVMMADAMAKGYTNIANGQAASRQAPIFLTGYEERQHHHQPVSFGLTLSYPLTNRLSLTSGVVYTQLQSEFTQIIHSQQITKEQKLHYVGVPLNANYRLWRYKGFKAYLAAGVQADWNVKTQLNAEGVEQEMSRDRLQWSVNGSLGLQYDVLPQLSLYAEPGINHYFDNGSPVQNFFKDKPTSLKLQLGIRLSLSGEQH